MNLRLLMYGSWDALTYSIGFQNTRDAFYSIIKFACPTLRVHVGFNEDIYRNGEPPRPLASKRLIRSLIIPSRFSFRTRRQHDDLEMPTLSARSATDSVAGRCRYLRISLSMSSIVNPIIFQILIH